MVCAPIRKQHFHFGNPTSKSQHTVFLQVISDFTQTDDETKSNRYTKLLMMIIVDPGTSIAQLRLPFSANQNTN